MTNYAKILDDQAAVLIELVKSGKLTLEQVEQDLPEVDAALEEAGVDTGMHSGASWAALCNIAIVRLHREQGMKVTTMIPLPVLELAEEDELT